LPPAGPVARRRIARIPDFRFYAIADGIKKILSGWRAAPLDSTCPEPGPFPQFNLLDGKVTRKDWGKSSSQKG